MSILSVSFINFIEGEPENLDYRDADEAAVLAQPTADVLRKVKVEVLVTVAGVPAISTTTAKIAYDAWGNQLKSSSHIVALPCPPYCDEK